MAMNHYWTKIQLAMNRYWITMELNTMIEAEQYGKRLFIFHSTVIVLSCLLNFLFLGLALHSDTTCPEFSDPDHCKIVDLLAVFCMILVWMWVFSFWTAAFDIKPWGQFVGPKTLDIQGSIACLVNVCLFCYVMFGHSTYPKDLVTFPTIQIVSLVSTMYPKDIVTASKDIVTAPTLKVLPLLEVVSTAVYGVLAICFVLEFYLRHRISVKDHRYLVRAAWIK